MSFLLDTNVLSEIRRAKGHPRIRQWFIGVRLQDVFLSTLVLGEVRQGIERLRRRDPIQAAVLDSWLATIHQDYADRLLPITSEIAETWGNLNITDPPPIIDGLMAATALVHGLTLVTRNTADVARTGVRLLDPSISEE